MANEITTERPVDLDFTPAKLDFTNYAELKKAVDDFAGKYRNFVFTRETKSVAMKARTELLAMMSSIESNRKRVKQVYNEPLNVFEQQIKDLTDLINAPLNDIRGGLNEIEAYEKQDRQDALNAFLTEQLADKTITLDELEIEPRWLNKGNWSDKLKPATKLVAEINFAIENAVKAKQQRADNVRILTEYCQSKNVDAAGWISQLDFKSVTEVIDLINVDAKRKAEIAQQQELKKQQYEAEQVQQQQTVAEPFDVEETPLPPEPLVTDTIQVTGTLKQLNELNQFLIQSGIQVKTIDALPF